MKKILITLLTIQIFTSIGMTSPLSDSLVGKFRTSNCVAFPQTTAIAIETRQNGLTLKSLQNQALTIEILLESLMDFKLPIAMRYSESLYTIRNEFFRNESDKYTLMFENTLARSATGNRVRFTSTNHDSAQKIECVFYRTK